jgi:HEAT repeat protein
MEDARMSAGCPFVFALATLLPFAESPPRPVPDHDVARLRELLYCRDHPRNQGQAALLLAQDGSAEARALVRQALRQTDAPEVFLALAGALRLGRDRRFAGELLAALSSSKPAIRQAAAETLACLADADLVDRLGAVAADNRAETPTRQAALVALGRSGRREAVPILIEQLSSSTEGRQAGEGEPLGQAAAEALADLTGRNLGSDPASWRRWWEQHKDLPPDRWLEERLAYQVERARRLEGDLDRARGQVVRLHQQLHARLPAADRLSHVQELVEEDDPAVRALAVGWSVELLPTADMLGQRALADVLLRLAQDGSAEVQCRAVLALGRVADPRGLDRLCGLLEHAPPPVRAAAARSLAQLARGTGPDAAARQKQVVPVLQRALADPALEVVLAAAEELGALGVPDAAPVLACLLRHPSAPVRLAAAQALEQVAVPAVIVGLLDALDDPAVTVRFSLVGALGRAAGDGKSLTEAEHARLLGRLEQVLVRDADPGVRGRAATVLGECGAPGLLPVLWQRVLVAEEPRVQEKAWAALVEIVARSANAELLAEWDRTLTEAKQGARRVQLLAEVCGRWQKHPEAREALTGAREKLTQAYLDQGKWAAAWPLVRELLNTPQKGSDADVRRYLRWLLTIGSQAMQEGNHAEARRVIEEAQPYLSGHKSLAAEFDQLQAQVQSGS